MKPWRSLEVGPYVPLVKWAIKSSYKWAAKLTKEPLWEVETEEVDALPLTEAVQKCLYDLRLSRWTENPYVALLVGLAGLTAAKYSAIKLVRMLEEIERRESAVTAREAAAGGRPSAAQHRPTSPANGSASAAPSRRTATQGNPDEPPPPPTTGLVHSQFQRATGSRPATNADFSMGNGRMPEFGEGSLSVGSPTPGNRTFSTNEFDMGDE